MTAATNTMLRTLRREYDWDQEALAAQVGVSRAHLSRVERGLKRPSPALRLRLAAALGTDPWNPANGDDS